MMAPDAFVDNGVVGGGGGGGGGIVLLVGVCFTKTSCNSRIESLISFIGVVCTSLSDLSLQQFVHLR